MYSGANAVAAYNTDNGAALTGLNEVSSSNHHWEDGTYDSKIFPTGNPNYTGTVGAGNLQDLLLEPTANFIFPTLRRFELTKVDVAALEDIGWSVIAIPVPSALVLFLSASIGVGAFGTGRRGRRPSSSA